MGNFLVLGATGRFGSIAPRLRERGHHVTALTRHPDAPTANGLRAAGVTVGRGDFDDPESLRAALPGYDGVFASGTLHRAGPDGEVRHGFALADAARVARVAHLVYVSGADAAPGTGVPVFDVKGRVEARLDALDIPRTVVAPVYLMENLFNPWNLDALRRHRLPTFIEPARRLQQVATEDVIAFSVYALEHADELGGRRVEIAGDSVDAREMAAAMGRVTGQHFEVETAAPELLPPPLAALFRWLDRVGQHVDIERLRAAYPAVHWHRFEEWLRLEGVLASMPESHEQGRQGLAPCG
jgi:uncharacterized protein YbjT (DUF2867 family)